MKSKVFNGVKKFRHNREEKWYKDGFENISKAIEEIAEVGIPQFNIRKETKKRIKHNRITRENDLS